MEDLSGLPVSDDDWLDPSALPDTLKALMDEIGRIYLPYLKANAEAVMSGAEQMKTMVDGQPWTQNPFTYQAKCFGWLVEDTAALDAATRQTLSDWLGNRGVLEQLS